jgi:hypothetical protein
VPELAIKKLITILIVICPVLVSAGADAIPVEHHPKSESPKVLKVSWFSLAWSGRSREPRQDCATHQTGGGRRARVVVFPSPPWLPQRARP